MNSSNNLKSKSSSSGNIWKRLKDYNYNNNNIPPILSIINPHPKGRKLIEDFDKLTNNKNIENEINTVNNIDVNKNNNNSINNKYNISNNNFSFLTPVNNKPKKEEENENENEKEKEKINENDNKIENKKESEIKKEIINNNKIIIKDKNNNENDNSNIINTTNHNNIFFTDYGLGYKCNCQKTQCNKNYCQCFSEGRYCFNCNCIDCNNKKPECFSTNKHQIEEENKDKKGINISCTCTKSGCNKNYCECFKNKVKCNNLCRCRNCENCEDGKDKDENILNFQNFKCCPANSIFIIKNKIVFEDVNKYKNIYINNKKKDVIKRQINITVNENLLSSCSSEENENFNIGHKRKRNDGKKVDAAKNISNKKSKISDENTDETAKYKNKNNIEGNLFDKNGKLILTNFKL